jgi:hypothetical protein
MESHGDGLTSIHSFLRSGWSVAISVIMHISPARFNAPSIVMFSPRLKGRQPQSSGSDLAGTGGEIVAHAPFQEMAGETLTPSRFDFFRAERGRRSSVLSCPVVITTAKASPLDTVSSDMIVRMPHSICYDCGACCRGRSGTVLILEADFRRWTNAGRSDLLDSCVEGHFGAQGLAVDVLGDCVHLKDRRCMIYELRPDTCRNFERGCAQCVVARRNAGYDRTSL